jgi:hypothetical protein
VSCASAWSCGSCRECSVSCVSLSARGPCRGHGRGGVCPARACLVPEKFKSSQVKRTFDLSVAVGTYYRLELRPVA